MSKAQHAPGPWTMHEINPYDPGWGACEIRATDNEFVSTMVNGVNNARLIAAAPELLDACEQALAAMQADYSGQFSEVEQLLIDAISNAGGEV